MTECKRRMQQRKGNYSDGKEEEIPFADESAWNQSLPHTNAQPLPSPVSFQQRVFHRFICYKGVEEPTRSFLFSTFSSGMSLEYQHLQCQRQRLELVRRLRKAENRYGKEQNHPINNKIVGGGLETDLEERLQKLPLESAPDSLLYLTAVDQ